MSPSLKIALSMLAAEFIRRGKRVSAIDRAGAYLIHRISPAGQHRTLLRARSYKTQTELSAHGIRAIRCGL